MVGCRKYRRREATGSLHQAGYRAHPILTMCLKRLARVRIDRAGSTLSRTGRGSHRRLQGLWNVDGLVVGREGWQKPEELVEAIELGLLRQLDLSLLVAQVLWYHRLLQRHDLLLVHVSMDDGENSSVPIWHAVLLYRGKRRERQ